MDFHGLGCIQEFRQPKRRSSLPLCEQDGHLVEKFIGNQVVIFKQLIKGFSWNANATASSVTRIVAERGEPSRDRYLSKAGLRPKLGYLFLARGTMLENFYSAPVQHEPGITRVAFAEYNIPYLILLYLNNMNDF